MGSGDFQSILKLLTININKTEKLLVNNWEFDRSNDFVDSKFLTSFKNVNYDIKNVENYKQILLMNSLEL